MRKADDPNWAATDPDIILIHFAELPQLPVLPVALQDTPYEHTNTSSPGISARERRRSM